MHLLYRSLIIAFILWHGAAVATASVPRDAVGAVAGTLRQDVYPLFRPYLLVTAQWQIWDLFAPDPLRRVSEITVEVKQGDHYVMRHAVRPENVEWYRRAYELKLLRRIVGGDYTERLAARYGVLFCEELNLDPGTALRLTHRYYVLPKTTSPRSSAYWESYRPKWKEKPLTEITCPT